MEEQNIEKPQKAKIKRRVVIILCAVIFIQVLILGFVSWNILNVNNVEDIKSDALPDDMDFWRREANYWKKLNVK